MKSSLYDALGIAPTASDDDVRDALRRVIRRYYTKTRDGQGNVEEALRFINHASRILTDPDRRRRYDEELALAAGTTDERIAHVISHAVAEEGTDMPATLSDPSPERLLEERFGEPESKTERALHHAGLTEQVAALGRPTILTIALCILFGAFIAAAIVLVTPKDAALLARQVLVWATIALVGLSLAYGSVHAVAWYRRREKLLEPPPQTDLAILNWRREKAVFFGAEQPQEDASWIFQLRMAELERAKSGRTSEPRPWSRLGARLFDYAFWGMVLALLVSELRGAALLSDAIAAWVIHPLVAPVLITVTWIPIEALLIAALQTTPGKWLFGCYVQFSISDAYASREMRAQLDRAFHRAFRLWWQGLGCGIPVLAPFLVAFAYERLAERQETDWDRSEDCLVTHGRTGSFRAATGVCGMAAMLWLYAVAWHQPMAESLIWVQRALARVLPSVATLVTDRIEGVGAMLSRGSPSASVAAGGTITSGPRSAEAAAANAAVDRGLAAELAQRRSRVVALSSEGPRMLRGGNYRRALDLCRAWTDLDLGNADAWRCVGRAAQALGHHQEAVAALRKAKQFDPSDRTLDAEIERSQHGIVADFLNRNAQ